MTSVPSAPSSTVDRLRALLAHAARELDGIPTSGDSPESTLAAVARHAGACRKLAQVINRELSQPEAVRLPEMRLVPNSSNVHSLGYDPAARQVFVQFRSGPHVYRYDGVSAELFRSINEAESIGSAVAQLRALPTTKLPLQPVPEPLDEVAPAPVPKAKPKLRQAGKAKVSQSKAKAK